MKKAYITPAVSIVDIECSGILALSAIDNGGNPIGGTDTGEGGDFEICSQKKNGYWDDTAW